MPLTSSLLKRFAQETNIFVETGTNRGDGVAAALEAGFKEVYTTDISVFNYGWCSCRFQGDNVRVHLHNWDSREMLVHLFSFMHERCTFWLDAHYMGGIGEMQGKDGGREEDHPLLDELRIIAMQSPRTHTLLIDDVRMFDTPGWPRRAAVEECVRAINPDYNCWLADSLEFESDILVAHVDS